MYVCVYTFSSATMHNDSRSTQRESFIHFSRRRLSCTANSDCRPASKCGAPMGLSSTLTNSKPSLGRVGLGCCTSQETCANILGKWITLWVINAKTLDPHFQQYSDTYTQHIYKDLRTWSVSSALYNAVPWVQVMWIWIRTERTVHLPSYLLTPWSRVLLEKLTSLQPVKKFPTFYGTQRFITTFTNACYQLDPIHTPTSHFQKIHLNLLKPTGYGMHQ